ncbi:hypothetical protein L207DRAFT_242987 [Hyaloscypha variabilis F]|uniref:Uncharacterized protein n=1 Tax=Hyaloscypha variabilis (strain UAMH 11265 / GT02V1 / F) TaxID=1149755 RepID=A0A2J6S2C5_HYAVF|nr:hypothetical protein L207DRAFT_242987 [Hyaloscypha variabilis F]
MYVLISPDHHHPKVKSPLYIHHLHRWLTLRPRLCRTAALRCNNFNFNFLVFQPSNMYVLKAKERHLKSQLHHSWRQITSPLFGICCAAFCVCMLWCVWVCVL